MYQVNSQDVANYIMSNGRSFRAKIVLDNYTISDDINSITWNIETANSDITPGDTISQSVTIDVTEIPEYDIIGKNFFLYIYAVNFFTELEEELIPCGRFKVEECKRNGNVWTIEGKDGFFDSDIVYETDLILPTYNTRIEREICNILDILEPVYERSPLFDVDNQQLFSAKDGELYCLDGDAIKIDSIPEETTCREMLGYCASLDTGKYSLVGRDGHLIHKGLTDIGYEITASSSDEPEIEVADIEFTQILCTVSDTEVLIAGVSEGSSITFENPYMTQDIIDDIADVYTLKPYRPLSVNHRLGDPRLDPLDLVTIKTADGLSFKIPLMNISFKYDGGFSAELEATGEISASESDSPTMRKVNKIVKTAQTETEAKAQFSLQNTIDTAFGKLGGYIYIETNEQGEPIALHVTNASKYEQATKKLTLNNAGIHNIENDESIIDLDGQINASKILTGILSRIILQSQNYSEQEKTGIKIDLDTGTIAIEDIDINGKLTFSPNSSSERVIRITYSGRTIDVTPTEISVSNTNNDNKVSLKASGIEFYNNNEKTLEFDTSNGNVTLYDGDISYEPLFVTN